MSSSTQIFLSKKFKRSTQSLVEISKDEKQNKHIFQILGIHQERGEKLYLDSVPFAVKVIYGQGSTRITNLPYLFSQQTRVSELPAYKHRYPNFQIVQLHHNC